MVQACTLFLSRMGRFGLGLLTLALPFGPRPFGSGVIEASGRSQGGVKSTSCEAMVRIAHGGRLSCQVLLATLLIVTIRIHPPHIGDVAHAGELNGIVRPHDVVVDLALWLQLA